MSEKTGLHSLLNELRRLYSQVALFLLGKRMRVYHEDSHTFASHDLSAKLSDHIERVAASAKARTPPEQVPSQKPTKPVETNTTTNFDQAQSSRPRPSVMGRVVKALSNHFRGHARYEMQPQLSEKLKNSAWNHIHTALRHARQGEVVTAKLHADIACNALKEVAHYMTDEEYVELLAKVEKALEQIKEQT